MAVTTTVGERMTYTEASEKYPKSYIVLQFDSLDSSTCTILFVCDTEKEAFEKLNQLSDNNLCSMIEGVYLQRSLGGIVVGG